MDKKIQLDNRKCTLAFKFQTRQPEKIRIVVVDPMKKNTVYADGSVTIDKEGYFYVRMPISPKIALIRVVNERNGNIQNDPSFKVEMKKETLKTKLNAFNHFDPKITSFLSFISEFAENAGILSAGNRSVYLSDDGKFRIDFVDVIRDEKGTALNTPARISKINNRIEFSKEKISMFTVPAIVAIGLHEFGHGYLNHDKSDEIEADLNALRIYLGAGFSRKEAYRVFCKVFNGVPKDNKKAMKINEERIRRIENFITKFEKEPTINYQYYYVGENGENA